MPYKDPADKRAWKRKFRRDRVNAGLCIDCGVKLTGRGTRCPKHYTEHQRRNAVTKDRRREQGLCNGCGRPKNDPDKVKCIVCSEPHHFNPFVGG